MKYKNISVDTHNVYNESNGSWRVVNPQEVIELDYKMDNPNFKEVNIEIKNK